MGFLNVISLLAGLAFFLYGIKLIRSGSFEENYERFRAKYNID